MLAAFGADADDDDADMRRAVEISRTDVGGVGADDADLQRVLLLSLAEADREELERVRLAKLEEACRLLTLERDRDERIRVESERRRAAEAVEIQRQADERWRVAVEAEEEERQLESAMALSVALASSPPYPSAPVLVATNSTIEQEQLEQAIAESEKTSHEYLWQTRAQDILKACGPLPRSRIRNVIEVTRGTGGSPFSLQQSINIDK